MKKVLLVLLLANFIATGRATAQVYLEPLVGYRLDLNNIPRLNQWSTAMGLAIKDRRSEFLVTAEKAWPVNSLSSDSSFTTNPSLPLYSPAQKKISPKSFSFAFGWRTIIAGREAQPHFCFLISVGVTHQNIKITYDYDKTNYTILNPDKTLETTGLFAGAGAEWVYPLKSGRLLVGFEITTPPWTGKINYPSSFRYTSPLSFNAAYSFQITTHHEKK